MLLISRSVGADSHVNTSTNKNELVSGQNTNTKAQRYFQNQ